MAKKKKKGKKAHKLPKKGKRKGAKVKPKKGKRVKVKITEVKPKRAERKLGARPTSRIAGYLLVTGHTAWTLRNDPEGGVTFGELPFNECRVFPDKASAKAYLLKEQARELPEGTTENVFMTAEVVAAKDVFGVNHDVVRTIGRKTTFKLVRKIIRHGEGPATLKEALKMTRDILKAEEKEAGLRAAQAHKAYKLAAREADLANIEVSDFKDWERNFT